MKLPVGLTLISILPFFWSCDAVSDKLDDVIIDGSQTKYYFNSEVGLDNNSGDTPDAPFKSLFTLRYADLKPGDTVFLAKDVAHRGSIILKNVKGTKEKPVVITSYGDGSGYGKIDASGNLAGIYMENCSNIKISGLSITADGSGGLSDSEALAKEQRCGILYVPTTPGAYSGITIENVLIEDVYFYDRGFSRGEIDETAEKYGYGIRILPGNVSFSLSDISVKDCTIRRVSRVGVLCVGTKGSKCVTNVEIEGLVTNNTGGPGIQVSHAKDIYIHDCSINRSGSTGDSRNFARGSGFWCFAVDRLLFEHNSTTNANGPADSAGAHIDYNCSNVIYQYNFSANNAGGFIEILGNNYNCSYRYNVSVNDGQRVKGGGRQAGRTLWLSKYSGLSIGPFNTYIYNNTIYVAPGKTSMVQIEDAADGVLIANNIFHVLGTAAESVSSTTNTFMEHNLFYSAESWAARNLTDSSPTYGDPEFASPGGMSIEDYIPANKSLVKDKGIVPYRLPGDEVGLYLGLKVEKDILGNPVDDKPDFGAFEIQ